MSKILSYLNKNKFYIYVALLVVANNLWFADFLGSWFVTLGILLTIPVFGLDFIWALLLIIEDGIFKLASFYFEPLLLRYYPIYLLCVIGGIFLLGYIIKRFKKERHELISTLHRLKSETVDLGTSTHEALNSVERRPNKTLALSGLIQEREESYKNILNLIKQNFHPYSIVLYLSTLSDASFYMREYISESENINTNPVNPGEGMLHAIFRERRIINIRRFTGKQHIIPYYQKREEVKSLLAMPLLSGKRLKGILCVDSLQEERFTIKEEEIIKGLAKELVKAIDSSEAMRGFSKMKDELLHVCELGTKLNNNLSQTEIVDVLMDITRKFINYDFSCFVSHDPGTLKNRIVRIQADTEQTYEGRDFTCDDRLGLTSWVIRNNVPLEYCQIKGKNKEIILFNKKFKIPFKYNSVLILPIRSYDRVLGAFILASNRGNICREEDKKMLEGICSQIGIALENSRMYETLRHLATVDGLTGLKNHRVFQEALAAEIQRFERHPDNFSLILVDIDHFKKINDTCGHPIGDFILKEISKILSIMVRKIDLAARYGGEEFALILVNTDQTGALKMAERIRKEVESIIFKKDNLSLKATLSLGIATYPKSASNKQDLIEAADRALYFAKANGRNQTIHFEVIQKEMPIAREIQA